MRKLLLSLVTALGMASLGLAGEVLLLKFDGDKKEVTVKDGAKEQVYRITDKTKVTFIDVESGSPTAGTVEAATKILAKPKALGKLKFDVTTDRDTITELKMRGKKAK
jgi:hypothetical protein